MIPVNDLNRTPPDLRAALAAALQRVLDRGWYILGPEVAAFEEEFARWCGAAHCVTVANGTDALEIALRALGVSAGDGVAAAANAGGYATTAIRAIGAHPVYADIDPATLTISPAALSMAISQEAPKAIVATHLYGRMAPMPELLDVARRAGIPVIEDCAQAHGAVLEGRRAGSWGAMGCFSFYPTKNLGACGDGGAIATSVPELMDRARALRQYGWTRRYESAGYGRNSRLDDMQAAILRAKLPLVNAWNCRRREVARRYTQALSGSRIACPPDAGEAYVAHLYVVRARDRERLRAQLFARGIATDVHYPIPDHMQESERAHRPAPPSLPETEAAAREVLTLPCYPELREDEVETICAVLREIGQSEQQ